MANSTPFAHLHLHSQYSLLDGANRLGEVLDAARDAEMPAVALTDHGNMFGAVEFYNQARARDIKPILGIEAYVAQGDRRERDRTRPSNNHLVLLARNLQGYRNLIKLTSSAYLEGFYYKPRIDHDLLREHSEGIIGLSACLKGEMNEQIVGGKEEEARKTARTYLDILGEGNFYLELQDHGIEEQRLCNEALRRIARQDGIPLVATNDCHYLKKSDSFAHDVLLCIGTQRMLDDPNRMKYSSDEFYLKTGDEIFKKFPNDAVALENTIAIAERCDLEIPSGQFHLPEFPVPAGETIDSYFETVVRAGLEERLAELRQHNAQVLEKFGEDLYWQRLQTEIEVIRNMGFGGYFLITWDFIRFANERKIPVGPGRGSAAGSLVSYSLRITDIDPLQYDLLFERFLNPERVSMPDIDIDFCMRRRGEVIHYVSDKYGRDKVAQIITFGTLAAKAVLRDVGRVMGTPYAKIDRVAKMVPDMTRSLSEAAREVTDIAREVERDPEVRQIVEVGKRLEGLTRHASLHAAGVVITPQPIEELVPLCKTSKGEIVTQWDKDVVEDLGLLKLDFLGLRTLTVIDDTLQTLKLEGLDLDLDRVPLDDERTFELFCAGRTNGIFQFESSGMKDLLLRAQPSRFSDLVAFNALYRPGALSVGMVEEYIQRKQGKRKVRYVLPQTKPLLEETYGVIAFQEQVMLIAVEVAGFSLGEADILRKAMGKKKPEVMAQLKEKFVDGAAGRGVDPNKAAELWEYIEPFAGYGFNKSHSVAYAMLAYKTAYLKAHHPVAFMAAMLTSEMSSKDNVAKYIQECREMGIGVLPPDVGESNWAFTVSGEAIRFGLGGVKGVGGSAVEAIVEARRECGRFRSLAHFARQVDLKALNAKVFDCLIKSGSFDSLGSHRGAMSESLERILDFAACRQREAEQGQNVLFAADAMPEPDVRDDVPEWPDRERLKAEKEVLGLYLTGNPLNEFTSHLERLTTHTTVSVREGAEGTVAIGGLVTRLRTNKIRQGPNAGRFMGRFVLEDLEGTLPVAVFAEAYGKFGRLLDEESVVVVKGAVRDRGSGAEMTVEDVRTLEIEEAPCEMLSLRLGRGLATSTMLELRDFLVEHQGDVPVQFELDYDGKKMRIVPEERFRVAVEPEFLASLESLLGAGNVQARYAEVAAV